MIDDGRADSPRVRRIAAGHGPVAVDAERASGFRYSQRAYLIQVFRRGAAPSSSTPPPIGVFAALQDAIGDVEWVLHAASQDLACLREVGLDPRRSSTPNSRPGCSAAPASGSARSSRTCSASPRQGALRRRLVDPPAAPVVARLCGARRRASSSTCATARRGARGAGKTEIAARGVRGRARARPGTVRARSRGDAQRGAHGARAPSARRRPRTVDGPRGVRARDRHRPRPPRPRPRARRGACIADPKTQAGPRRGQGVHRPREPHASSTAGGLPSRRAAPSPDLPARAGSRRRAAAAAGLGRPQPRGRRAAQGAPGPPSRPSPRSWRCRSRTC